MQSIREKKTYVIYILHCNNGSYYTGYSTNIARRYQQHVEGKGSKYTRSFKPVGIAQCWQVLGNKSLAMRIEKFIKTLSKKEKTALIHFPEKLTHIFQEIKCANVG